MTGASRAALISGLALLGGCTIPRMATPAPSVAVIDRIGAAQLPPIAVGTFVAAPGLSDRALGVRAASVRPEGGSFAAYLGEALKVQLKATGKLDPDSPLVVSGALIDNDVSAAIGKGRGRLAAEFVVTRGGRELFRKTLRVEREWGSSFIGAIAIDTADRLYAALYTDLIGLLIDDPDFRAALRRDS